MIVYNVKRRWFPMKNDAEAYRKAEGLPPSETFTLRVESREDLAALLNGLCGMDENNAALGVIIPTPLLAPDEIMERNQVADDIPDCVPRFLREDWAKRMPST